MMTSAEQGRLWEVLAAKEQLLAELIVFLKVKNLWEEAQEICSVKVQPKDVTRAMSDKEVTEFDKDVLEQRTRIKLELKRISDAVDKINGFEELNSIRQDLHFRANHFEEDFK